MQLFDTSRQAIVPFEPGPEVTMYVCGITPYDSTHLGHANTYLTYDLLIRRLEDLGHTVKLVRNITDVDDSILPKARALGIDFLELAAAETTRFHGDMVALNTRPVFNEPHATQWVAEMVEMVKTLDNKGHAYNVDGTVFFDVSTFDSFGAVSGYDETTMIGHAAERGRQPDDPRQRNPLDFILWQPSLDDEPRWPSPWGDGRPDWHIECSAMSMELLGPSFDLHLGGEDLVFPHHEDEIAQSEGACLQCDGHKFVKYWMHGAHLLVEGKKMSKSLGNFFTLRDLLAKGSAGREVRYLMISAHYRETFNFTLDNLAGAKTALGRIDECTARLRELALGQATEPTADSPLVKRFTEAMDDDLNVSAAWGAVFDWVRDTNRKLAANDLTAKTAATELANWEYINSVLGIESVEEEAPPEIAALAEERQAARKAKNFTRSDQIRDELAAQGWIIEDTPKGPRVKRA